jgi:hypothetical protein
MANTTKYREKLSETRRHDLEHTEMMESICALGNKTLEEFRKLCKQDQETFMIEYTKNIVVAP